MAEYTIDKIEYDGNVYKLQDNVSGYAPLASPALTGTPTAPTATSGDSSTQIATTAFVQDAMSGAGAGTVTSVGVSNATNGGLSVSGSPVTSSGTITIGHSNVLTSAQTTEAVYPIKIDKNGHISSYGSAVTIPTDTNTTYTLTNALSSHKFTWTLTAGGSGSGSTTTTAELVAGTGITLTDDTTNKKITIASSITNTDEKLVVAGVTSGTTYYPIVGTGTTAATRQYDSNGFQYTGTFKNSDYTNYQGYANITLGNSNVTGIAYNQKGVINLYSDTAYSVAIHSIGLTDDRSVLLPNKSGTIALTDDIPDVSGKIDTAGTGLSKSGTTLNHSNSVTAQTTQAVYSIKIDAQGHISEYGSAITIPTITLNGSSTTSPSFYAPTSAGTSGYVLTSAGSGAPSWSSAVLTDENVKTTAITSGTI